MKAHLMFQNQDFEYVEALPPAWETTIADLALQQLLQAMAQGDVFIQKICTSALLSPLQEISQIAYRQAVLKDSVAHPEMMRALYRLCIETEEKQGHSWFMIASHSLSGIYSSAIELLTVYIQGLKELRSLADHSLAKMQSEAMIALFTMLQEELPDAYFSEVKNLLDELKKDNGTLIAAQFGGYLQGVSYTLSRKNPEGFKYRWWHAPKYTIPDRDDEGAFDLSCRRGRALNEAADVLAQAAKHLQSFFEMLKRETAFYVGCLNLYDAIKALGMPLCLPTPMEKTVTNRQWQGLYDGSLALMKHEKLVGNDCQTEAALLYIITGANQGGKTTFLRSIGQAQLMMQAGMMVFGTLYSGPLKTQIFTHFRKEEDHCLRSGKLDEELGRLSDIVDGLQPKSLLLFNESFASTNEREGSEIFRQITKALVENGVEVFSVTHLYTYACAFLESENTYFLRAQRLTDGERTYKMVQGLPMQTAFGEDIYKKIFGGD